MSILVLQSSGLLPCILSFLAWDELIITIRLVNHSWNQAVTCTPVECFPTTTATTYRQRSLNDRVIDVFRDSFKFQKLMNTLPRIQKLCIFMPLERSLRLVVNGLKELKALNLASQPAPAGVVDSTQNSYSADIIFSICCHSSWKDCLKELDVSNNSMVEMDLQQVAQLSQLEVFNAVSCRGIHGQLSSLATLPIKVCDLQNCKQVQGRVRDLAGCSHLLYLGLRGTNVMGCLSDLQLGDCISLIYLDWIHGGSPEELQQAQERNEDSSSEFLFRKDLTSVKSASKAVQRVYDLRRVIPSLRLDLCSFELSVESPDYYSKPNHSSNGLWRRDPPFIVVIFQVQGRMGWRWTNGTHKGVCEIRWMDPLPSFDSPKQHARYQSELQLLTPQEAIYQGFWDPPAEEEHNDLMYKNLIERRRRERKNRRIEN